MRCFSENDLAGVFTEADIHAIAYEAPTASSAGRTFPGFCPGCARKFMVVSFTILSYRLIIDTARINGLSWDAVFVRGNRQVQTAA